MLVFLKKLWKWDCIILRISYYRLSSMQKRYHDCEFFWKTFFHLSFWNRNKLYLHLWALWWFLSWYRITYLNTATTFWYNNLQAIPLEDVRFIWARYRPSETKYIKQVNYHMTNWKCFDNLCDKVEETMRHTSTSRDNQTRTNQLELLFYIYELQLTDSLSIQLRAINRVVNVERWWLRCGRV